jgi:hypothetical protein
VFGLETFKRILKHEGGLTAKKRGYAYTPDYKVRVSKAAVAMLRGATENVVFKLFRGAGTVRDLVTDRQTMQLKDIFAVIEANDKLRDLFAGITATAVKAVENKRADRFLQKEETRQARREERLNNANRDVLLVQKERREKAIAKQRQMEEKSTERKKAVTTSSSASTEKKNVTSSTTKKAKTEKGKVKNTQKKTNDKSASEAETEGAMELDQTPPPASPHANDASPSEQYLSSE